MNPRNPTLWRERERNSGNVRTNEYNEFVMDGGGEGESGRRRQGETLARTRVEEKMVTG